YLSGMVNFLLPSVHPETALKIPKLKLWTPKNGHLGVQSFSFGSVSGWTLPKYRVGGGLPISHGLAFVLIVGWSGQAFAGTAFTYQGQLKESGVAVTATCTSMDFKLFDASSGGTQKGSTVSKSNVSVVDGLFTTQLDFGNVFDGTDMWLEITVDCGSGSTTLSRQPLTPIPYAIHAQSVSGVDTTAITDGTIVAADIATDAVETAEIKDANVTEDKLAASLAFDDGDLLNLSAINASGTGEGLTLPQAADVSLATAEGQVSWDSDDNKLYVGNGTTAQEICWGFTGNNSLVEGINFLGNTDNVPLNFRVFNERVLRIEHTGTADNSPNIIGGYSGNNVTSGKKGAFIGGGGQSGSVNSVTANYGTVAGGSGNTASGNHSTVAGGIDNTASGNHSFAVGLNNTASGNHSFAAGKENNVNEINSFAAGRNNIVEGNHSFAAGRENNVVGNNSFAAGRENQANGNNSFAAGRENHANGNNSFAAGRMAKIDTSHVGSFLFADSTNADFNSAAANEFAVRAKGGVRFITNSGGTTGATLAAGSSAWAAVSDRNKKENFASVDGREILEKVAAMPIETWNYKTQDDDIRHIGPMAQDFRAAFSLGTDDKTITTVDADGVALSAIQGLYQLVQEQRAALEAQKAEIEALKAQNQQVTERLQRVEARFLQAQQ
ncbi:tail fiber domain-containing protein, partial [Candidatus Marithioploca araucensis]|nr:tail fiber domain-containing protein [Candidatus Marithioploca araucensis]